MGGRVGGWLKGLTKSHGQSLSEGLRCLEDTQHLLLRPTHIAGAVRNVRQARHVMPMYLCACTDVSYMRCMSDELGMHIHGDTTRELYALV